MISFVKMKIHEFQSKICENTNLHVEAEAFVESVNESIALIEGSLDRTVDIITTFKTLTQDSLQTEEEAVEVKDCLQSFGNLIKFYVAHIMDDQESQLNIVVDQNTINCILRVTLSGVKVSKMFEEKMFEPHLMVSSESSLNGLELFIAHQLVTQILNGSMDHEVLNDTEHLYTIKL